MQPEFPAAATEIPVDDVDQAAPSYVQRLGFNLDGGGEAGAPPDGGTKYGGDRRNFQGTLQTVPHQSSFSRGVQEWRTGRDLAQSQ